MGTGFNMGLVRNIRELLTGRWQLPLAVVAAALFAHTLWNAQPPPKQVDFESLWADVVALTEGEAYYDAANAAANLLAMTPPLPKTQQAMLHDQIAEITFRVESMRRSPNQDNSRTLLDHQESARRLGLSPGARAGIREAEAQEWLGEAQKAADALRAVLARNPSSEERRFALRGLVRLLDGVAGSEAERGEHIRSLLGERGVSPAFVWWALRQGVGEALSREDFDAAKLIIETFGSHFSRPEFAGYQEYLQAWIEVAEGKPEQAQPRLDWIDAWLISNAVGDEEMHRAGFLPALCNVLRGRVDLDEERPQAALHDFETALSQMPRGEVLADASLGRVAALARLDRHDTSRTALKEALSAAKDDRALGAFPQRARKQALELFHDRDKAGDAPNAIEYLSLVLDLTSERDREGRLEILERLGRQHESIAAATEDVAVREVHRTASGRAYEQAAGLSIDEPARRATLLWWSGQAFDSVGRMEDARRALLTFLEHARSDPRAPGAMLHMGQSFASEGRFDDANRWLNRLIEEFPALEDASRARLLMAQNYLDSGESGHARAEELLTDLIESGRVAPGSPVFREALIGLCDLLYAKGRYSAAISRLEQFAGLYPDDNDRRRMNFQLADSFARSARNLLDSPPSGRSSEAARGEARERFRQAAKLFDDVHSLETAEEAGDGESDEYRRLALLHRGACLLALGDADSLDAALSTFRQAAARYQGTPTSLTAQVQITNILLRQGKVTEAARAIERAGWLLRGMPDGAFQTDEGGMGRREWDRYLASISSSRLFRDIFRENP